MKLYICKVCGNIITKLNDSSVPVVCCGEQMEELVPGVTDGAMEKHVPDFLISTRKDGTKQVAVTVGAVLHPMMKEHYIQWIIVETNKGFHVCKLTPDCEPKANFELPADEEVTAVYEYCNLHGLWKADNE